MKFLKRFRIKKKVKKKVAEMVATGYLTVGQKKVDAMYNRLFSECAALLRGDAVNGSWKYWKGTVLDKFFGKNVKGGAGALEGEALELRKWLEGFWKRLRENALLSEQDRKVMVEKFIPFMQGQHKKGVEFDVVLDQYRLKREDFLGGD